MLSRAAISVPQLMQAEAGFTTERCSGTRAATTFRKLPSASPGAKANAAMATSTPPALSARRRRCLNAAQFPQLPCSFVIAIASSYVAGMPGRSVPIGT
jgi:hypothetical protein